jgi:replication-associated recombination protein RarA
MKTYNLKQKQFNWLLKLASNDESGLPINIPWDLRKRAAELLKSVGYLREYNYTERAQLIKLRDDYIRWKDAEVNNDLPF